ncbi:hypothetical protein SAMN05192563_106610 [Paraburkholderia aspalathi]|uniref:Uncharacterized protein n=1 Tax=Paraburkholderia aspalathi TaxID=1324617 RepID=A0A1I7ES30_9BURK|nr:hypothetical protein SAMN05192563_106610 [Paraburkholderia aspalathi]
MQLEAKLTTVLWVGALEMVESTVFPNLSD